jgi:HTH-type transcriptional regulator / antitoxin HipB
MSELTPIGHMDLPLNTSIRSTLQLGECVRQRRRVLALTQLDVAGLGNTGNRFIIELERGKPTVQLQKVLDVLDLLGLELVVRAKTGQTGAGRR